MASISVLTPIASEIHVAIKVWFSQAITSKAEQSTNGLAVAGPDKLK